MTNDTWYCNIYKTLFIITNTSFGSMGGMVENIFNYQTELVCIWRSDKEDYI